MEFNRLEKDILNWYIANIDDYEMCFQLSKAKLKKRNYTGVGFFVEITVPTDIPKIREDLHDINPYLGPFIESPELDGGGETVLYVNDGITETLEIYAYGNYFPEAIEQYTLIEPQINKNL